MVNGECWISRDTSHTDHASSPMQDPKSQTPDPDRRAASHMIMGMIFLSQTMVGVLGNSSLLHYYVFLYFTQIRLKSTDWILMHLIVANFLTLLCKGVPPDNGGFWLERLPR